MTQAATRVRPAPALHALQKEFDEAARRAGGVVERDIALCGMPVSLRFAGSSVAGVLGRAFAHLEGERVIAPRLVLHAWDSAASGAPRPTLAPARMVAPDPTGTGPSFYVENDEFRALHQPATDSLSVLAASGNAAWFWVPDAAMLPYWDYTAPFRHLLAWWLAAHGHRLVHGAAVGRESGGVLIVGRGGSGKSTTSLSVLVDSRLQFAGDDYVAVGLDTPDVHSLYSFAKVHWNDLGRLPYVAAAVGKGAERDEKAVVHVSSSFEDSSTRGFPLRAIVVPRISGEPTTRAVETTHAAAVAALAPSTIFQLYPPARTALKELTELARSLPTFSLELGTDVASIPDELVQLLERLP